MQLSSSRRALRDPADVTVPLLVLLVAATAHLVTSAAPVKSVTSCDWSISDSAGSQDDVRTLETSCSEGQLQWQPALGAVKVAFLAEPDVLCVRMRAQHTGLALYLLKDDVMTQLVLLDGSDAHVPEMCRAVNGSWSLLLVSTPVGSLLAHVTMDYSIHSADQVPLEEEDCQPCAEKELVQRYCSSQFALEGAVQRVSDTSRDSLSQLAVRVQRAWRGESHPALQRGADGHHLLYLPSRCQARAPALDLIVIGHFRLGRPVVTCSAHVSQWRRARDASQVANEMPPCWLGDS